MSTDTIGRNAPYMNQAGGMGRRNVTIPSGSRCYLRAVPALGRQSGADYDPGGAYWGSVRGDWRSGLNGLWCAWDSDGEGVFYVRAKDRAEAKRLTLIENPGVTFFR